MLGMMRKSRRIVELPIIKVVVWLWEKSKMTIREINRMGKIVANSEGTSEQSILLII